jgi:hypothetical protein
MNVDKINVYNSERHPTEKWIPILIFILLPWIWVNLFLILTPRDVEDEFSAKIKLFENSAKIDTILVGDSRTLAISGNEFEKYQWKFFNYGLSGLSPDDVNASLYFSMANRQISRVVMGVSFENMTQSFPYEFSRYSTQFLNLMKQKNISAGTSNSSNNGGVDVFTLAQELESSDVSKKENINKRKYKNILNLIRSRQYQEIASRILSRAQHNSNGVLVRASAKFHALLDVLEIKKIPPMFNLDGSANYNHIQQDILSGKYDFIKNRAVELYWGREDSEQRYEISGHLSQESQDLYKKIFSDMRKKRIPMLVFETGRTEEYQEKISSSPILSALQSKWRTFYLEQENDCIRFLDNKALEDIYEDKDFFDACHFAGSTADRLSKKLAQELANLEHRCKKY